MSRLSTEEFKKRAINTHGDKYGYDKVTYTSAKTNVTIFCKKHRSFFEQRPDAHVRGQGCPKCGGSLTCDNTSFINKARRVHADEYGYEAVKYVNSHTPVEIYCKKCDVPFKKAPTHHLSGQGCPECSGFSKQITTASFVKKAQGIHGGKYNYDLVEYSRNSEKVAIFCKIHKQYFFKTPANHLKGQGCPDCSTSGFKKGEPALLYYLRVAGVYKIGVTNRSVMARFTPNDLKIITIIKVWEYATGKEALKKEQQILRDFVGARYTGVPLLSSGNSEMFRYDILGEDNGA